jgi:hypothetical protein
MSVKDMPEFRKPRALSTQPINVKTQAICLHNRQCNMARTRSIVYTTLFSCSPLGQHSLLYRMFRKIRMLFHRSHLAQEKVIWIKLSLLKYRRFDLSSYVAGNWNVYWIFQSSGIWRPVTWQIVTGFSKDLAAPTFRIKQVEKMKTTTAFETSVTKWHSK